MKKIICLALSILLLAGLTLQTLPAARASEPEASVSALADSASPAAPASAPASDVSLSDADPEALPPEPDEPNTGGDVAINETNFPDEKFRNVVKQYDIDSDNVLSPDEIAGVTEIDCSGCGITSLKGIEYFTLLTKLNCEYNQLTSLDVSGCTALKSLSCSNNQLTELDVGKNMELGYLDCSCNHLTALDVSKNAALTYLICSINQLTALNVCGSIALESLICTYNQLLRWM